MDTKERAEKIEQAFKYGNPILKEMTMLAFITSQLDEAVREAVNAATKAHADHVRWRCKLCIQDGFTTARDKAAEIAKKYFPQSKWDLHDVREIEVKRVCEEVAERIRAMEDK